MLQEEGFAMEFKPTHILDIALFYFSLDEDNENNGISLFQVL